MKIWPVAPSSASPTEQSGRTVKRILHVGELAKAAGLSVQSIRNYEKLGFLPAAERSASGYRLYTQYHLDALRVSRLLIAGYGWRRSRQIMANIHAGDVTAALVLIDERHAEIHRNRQEVEQILNILRATSSLPELEHIPRYRRGLYVHEAAREVKVRTSAVRYWETRGLLQPGRDPESHYRLYDAEQLRRLQVVTLLRKANYDFEAIRMVLNQLAQGTPDQAVLAAQQRLKELAEISKNCMQSAAVLWQYIESSL
ncbi:MAG: MerR family transcriptional regulator [Ktedonobacteraceae bacterium]|nr:MerR family transcriptional regulator [Ktedonobacteraceae bacterium]